MARVRCISGPDLWAARRVLAHCYLGDWFVLYQVNAGPTFIMRVEFKIAISFFTSSTRSPLCLMLQLCQFSLGPMPQCHKNHSGSHHYVAAFKELQCCCCSCHLTIILFAAFKELQCLLLPLSASPTGPCSQQPGLLTTIFVVVVANICCANIQ